MSVDSRIVNALNASAKVVTEAASDESIAAALRRVAEMTIEAMRKSGRVLICGNGGSAAEATHFAGEFVGAFLDRERQPLPAIPLGFDPSSLTSVANDFGYERVFARQLAALGRRGDILWALTTSGNSPNILAVLEQAREQSITTVLFTDHAGGKGRELADVCLLTPEAATPRVQELHLLYGHVLCEVIEAELARG